MLPGGGGIGRPEADSGRAEGGGGIGRPEAETGPGGRGGGAEGGVAPGASGRAGGAGGRGAPVGGMPAGVAGRGAGVGVGRPLEMNPLRPWSPAGSVGAGVGVCAGASVTAGAGCAAGGTSTTGSGTTTGAGSTTGVSTTSAAGSTSTVGVAFFATAFLATAFFTAAFFTGLSASSPPSAVFAAAFFAGAFFAAAFFSGFGSSGCSSRTRPSRSARRRTRSACASMIDDEWLFTSMPMTRQRSTASLLVRPSSLASSWTRMFFGNLTSAFQNRITEVGTGQRDGSAQGTTEIAAVERSIDAGGFAAQPGAATVRRFTDRKATIDEDVTHETARVEATPAAHARACRTMTTIHHYSAASGAAAPPPAHSFSLMTVPSAACHSISPVASFGIH